MSLFWAVVAIGAIVLFYLVLRFVGQMLWENEEERW